MSEEEALLKGAFLFYSGPASKHSFLHLNSLSLSRISKTNNFQLPTTPLSAIFQNVSQKNKEIG